MSTKKEDLTRIEDLCEYQHESDTEVDELLHKTEQIHQDPPAPPPLPEKEEEGEGEEELSWEPAQEPAEEEKGEGGQAWDPSLELSGDFEEEGEFEAQGEGEAEMQTQSQLQEESEPEEGGPMPPPETFQDLRDFGDSLNYGIVSTGGNPPYSIILKEIRYEEDAHQILTILKEHGLCNEDNEKDFLVALENGSLLLSQISEYSALYLAHRLRRFDLDIQLGLSEEIYPAKSYENKNRGLVSKSTFKQGLEESCDLTSKVTSLEDIILATTPTLENYTIHSYLQVVTANTLIEEEELILSPTESSMELNDLYGELANELRSQAYKCEANAIVGIHYQIIPFAPEKGAPKNLYKITCTGNAVWVIRHSP